MTSNKTLIVILGQTRAWEYTYEKFVKNFKDPLNADLCLVTSPHWANPYTELAKYWFSFSELYWETDPSFNNWRELFSGINGELFNPMVGPKGSGGLLFYFRKIFSDFSHSVDNYDYYIFTRSDFVWDIPHPPVDWVKSIAIPDGEHYFGYTDRHHIVHKKYLKTYLDIFNIAFYNPKSIKELMDNRYWNMETYIKFMVKLRGIPIQTYPYTMYTIRGEKDPTRWAVGDYNQLLGGYIKYPTEYEHYRDWREKIVSIEDWNQYLPKENL